MWTSRSFKAKFGWIIQINVEIAHEDSRNYSEKQELTTLFHLYLRFLLSVVSVIDGQLKSKTVIGNGKFKK